MTSIQSRKRSYAEDGSSQVAKKRALTSGDGSPMHAPNGGDHDEEPKDETLEAFRKEAIYRRMKHYSRQYERSQVRIAQLEERHRATAAGMIALETCWNLLVASIQILLKPEQLDPAGLETHDVFRFVSGNTPEDMSHLKHALEERSRDTEKLVATFMRCAPHAMTHDDILRKCQIAQAESATLASELTLVRASLEDSKSQLYDCRENLANAQLKVDRLQGSLDRIHNQAHTQTIAPPQVDSPSSGENHSLQEDSRHTIHEVPQKVESLHHLSEMASTSHIDAVHFQEGFLSGKADSLHKLTSLEEEIEQLQGKLRHLNTVVVAQDPDEVKKSDIYVELVQYASKLEHRLQTSRKETTNIQTRLAQLLSTRVEVNTELKEEYDRIHEESQKQILERDSVLSRLRHQRDQYQAELLERRAVDKNKVHALDQMTKLTHSQSERIQVLQSQVKRLRAQLAAEAGQEDILRAILDPNDVSVLDGLRDHLSNPNTAHQEQDLEEKPALVTKELEISLTGHVSDGSQSLVDQVQEKNRQLEQLRLQEIARQQADAAMEDELTKVSTAWEELEKQVKEKVFNLAGLEERLQKATVDKHKSDNKYFAAMREKEAVDTERKKTLKALQAQELLTEKVTSAEKAHLRRMGELEKERLHWQKAMDELKQNSEAAERSAAQATAFSAEVRGKMAMWRKSNVELQKALDDLKRETKVLTEDLANARKEIERESVRANKAVAPGSVREADLQKQVDQAMSILKCSCCKNNMRSTVITKCMHSFCKDCVEARLTTRQRKCPACGLSFGTQDVQTFYFQ